MGSIWERNRKKIIWHCIICRRYEATLGKLSQFAGLPEKRVSKDPPFTHIGLDFVRSHRTLHIKEPRTSSENDDSVSRSKVFVCLFICTSFRTIHLDSRTECARFLIGFQQICQQTRTTGYRLQYNRTMQKLSNLPARKSEILRDHRSSGDISPTIKLVGTLLSRKHRGWEVIGRDLYKA